MVYDQGQRSAWGGHEGPTPAVVLLVVVGVVHVRVMDARHCTLACAWCVATGSMATLSMATRSMATLSMAATCHGEWNGIPLPGRGTDHLAVLPAPT